MHKTCFAEPDGDTPIRDLFPISTMEKPRQEQVNILSHVHVLGPFFGLLLIAPASSKNGAFQQV